MMKRVGGEDMLRTLGGPSMMDIGNQNEMKMNEDEDAKSPEVESERVTVFRNKADDEESGNESDGINNQNEEEDDEVDDDDIVIVTKGGDEEMSLERDEFVVEGDDEVTLKENDVPDEEINLDEEDVGGLNEESMDDDAIIEDIMTVETLQSAVDYQGTESIDVDAIELIDIEDTGQNDETINL